MIKTMLKNESWQNNAFCTPSLPFLSVFHTKLTISELKSIITINELGPPVLESLTRISKFYAPADSEHKFNKTEIEN